MKGKYFHLSRRMGSSATAFNLNTLALSESLSCDRMMMALSVLRLGRVARLLSITNCEGWSIDENVFAYRNVQARTINSPHMQSSGIKGAFVTFNNHGSNSQ